jgi:PAS domain S-box-containing protein
MAIPDPNVSVKKVTVVKNPKERKVRSGSRPKRADAAEAEAWTLADGRIPVAGIGASAGGIEALARFFDAMPPDSGCAFVVVLHLDPKHESEMARILGNHTKMPVVQVEDGMRIAANHVYVIAPDTDLKLSDGALMVSKPSKPRGQRHPVDVLFASIAVEQHERAIAIVLSGTGSNGTEGLREVRSEGGMSLVQVPETAKFDGMPRSAIAAGLADHVLAPEEMPGALLAYVHHDYVSTAAKRAHEPPTSEATIDQVLEVLHARNGHDFGRYKRNTLRRRIHRRMGLRSIETLAAYLNDLRTNAEEVAALTADLMISVTGFFRDSDAWNAFGELVIAPLVAERENGAPVRVWVPACSTGEEAYSMAMLITEQAEAAGKRFELKVFATDAQEDNLRKARDGIYPAAALSDLPPERIRRFFEKLDGSFQVSKELRDMVVFAAQDLLRDPPFSRLDVVSCRNFLIYLEPEAQQRIIARCHFALRSGAYLFLGNAETIGRHDDLFETISKKWRIFRRVGPTRHDLIDYPMRRDPPRSTTDKESLPTMSEKPLVSPAEIARHALLEHYAPASVLIDQKGRVVYFHGTTRDYLEQPPGEPTRDLLAMARDGLAFKLRGAIREASKGDKSVTVHGRVQRSGPSRDVTVTLMPLPSSPQGSKLILVSFVPRALNAESDPPSVREDAGETKSGERALQEELVSMRAELRNTIEQLETANEELKASNEEATSMNEELQSTNEELETSKEELQSFNEELNTVNSQLQHKIGELERTTNDLNNLLAGSEAATLFLDTKLAITWFAPATKELFDLVTSDIGRPITHFARKFSDENLLPDAETVLKKLTTIEAEVPSDAGRWYLRRMLPYRTRDNRIAGVVVTFSDITERKKAAEAVNEAKVYAEAIVGTVRQPLLVLDAELRVQSANPAFYDLFRVSKKETEGSLLYDLGDEQWDSRALRTLLDDVLSKNHEITDYAVEHELGGSGRRCLLLNARRLAQGGGRKELILLAIEDITKRRESEAVAERLATIVESSDDAIVSKDIDGTITSWNIGAQRLFGYEADEIIGRSIMTLVPQDRHDEERDILDRIGRGEHIKHYETQRQHKDGSVVWVSLTISPIKDGTGKVVGASKIARDMTERRRADQHRKTLMGELNHRVKNTMAVIQSIASQTLGHASTLEEAREAFSSRLINLAKAHDVLTRESWQSANLADIVSDTVKPHAGGENRFRIEGPNVRLAPSAALAISMALHELSTNAAKYGALSTEDGHVVIVWEIEDASGDRHLVLHWEESGGPPVAKPTRKGFGSRLIERALASELGGQVHVEYRSSGLVCAITAPLPAGQELLGGQGGDEADSDRRG